MAYIETEGVFRCRLQQDPSTNAPCIAVDEHYAWDAQNKCLDKSKPLGGLQIVLRVDAYRINEDGKLSNVRDEINMDNFGITIITKKEQGEKVRQEVIANFVRIFGLDKPEDILSIGNVDADKLLNAVFDVRTYFTTSKTTGKSYLNYWFAPIGEANMNKQAFAKPSANKSALDKFRAKLRVDCKDMQCASKPAQTGQNSLPARNAVPTPSQPLQTQNTGLPPRSAPTPEIDLNDVWEMWSKAYPEDVSTGDKFYSAIQEMYGNKSAQDLSANELSAFVKKYLDDIPDTDIPF